MKIIGLLTGIILCAMSLFPFSASAQPIQVKELNFVFLHGAGGHADSMQPLSDEIQTQIRDYIAAYEGDNPGVSIQANVLLRGYPNDVDISTWANNIADSINNYFPGKNNLILIGHSMGGKSALYGVAHNTKGLADKVSTVITINSPILALKNYFAAGGAPAYKYCRAAYLLSDHGVCASVTDYDSSADADWVVRNKHWLAFISAESAPSSPQFDRNGVDPAPRDMDDGVVPISAQYTDSADVVYYGEHDHSDFSSVPDVTRSVAGYILKYIFGGTMGYSVRGTSGTFVHSAGWLPVKYNWTNIVSQSLAASGKVDHYNGALFSTGVWNDTLGTLTSGNIRSSFQTRRLSLPFLTGITNSGWTNQGELSSGLISVQSKALPKMIVRFEWQVFQTQLLPGDSPRNHYEIKIDSATPQAGIPSASWTSTDIHDARITINSNAMGPFKWYKAHWQIFTSQSRFREIIAEIGFSP